MTERCCKNCGYQKGNVFHHCFFYGKPLLVTGDDCCSNFRKRDKHTENIISDHEAEKRFQHLLFHGRDDEKR